jgi:hypothetical protein
VVAVRLATLAPDTLARVDRCISRWIAEKEAAGVGLMRDLVSSPTAAAVCPGRIDVVFNGTAGSRMWTDWMVDLTQQLSEISGSKSKDSRIAFPARFVRTVTFPSSRAWPHCRSNGRRPRWPLSPASASKQGPPGSAA